MLLSESFLVVRRVEVGNPGRKGVAADSSDGDEVGGDEARQMS